jgi:NADPH-dependent curcumin reductase
MRAHYKHVEFAQQLTAACPKGIDIYFESVGGAVTEAVAALLNPGARVPICGYISAYNATDITQVRTPSKILAAAPHVPIHRFFLVSEWDSRFAEATAQLSEWVRDGKIKYRESIGVGITNAPALFRGLLSGENLGKQLVNIADA